MWLRKAQRRISTYRYMLEVEGCLCRTNMLDIKLGISSQQKMVLKRGPGWTREKWGRLGKVGESGALIGTWTVRL